jgi:uncharacterized protein Usg
MEVSMVSRVGVSEDFRKQVLGYGLTTAQILYRMPDHPSLLQTYVWQNYDLFPKFPALKDFLSFWEKSLEGPLFSVTVAHSKLIKPAELRAVDGVFRLHGADRVGWAEAHLAPCPPCFVDVMVGSLRLAHPTKAGLC